MKKLKESSIEDVYKNHCHEIPETILLYIKEFILKQAWAFRRGFLTMEDFLIATHYGLVYRNLWNMKNRLVVEERYLSDTSFFSAWEEWKATGKTKNVKWIFEACSQCGNPAESVDWIFKVLDTLLIPPSQFKGISKSEVTEFPNIIYAIQQDSVSMMLTENCIDTSKIRDTSLCPGKTISLRFDGGTVIEFTLSKSRDSYYLGQGTISNYMNSNGKISIHDNGEMRYPDVYFNERKFSRYQVLMGTYFYPIPHPKWKKYEVARLARALHTEAEYIILRLPYLIGITESPQKPKDKSSQINILRFPHR